MSSDTEKQAPGAANQMGRQRTDESADILLEAQRTVNKWNAFLEVQKALRVKQAAQLQEIMDISGLSAKGVDPSDPVFAQIAGDLEFQRQLSLQYGLRLDKAEPVDVSKPDVSRWRQRTRALKV